MTREPSPKPVRRTVGKRHHARLTVLGEENGAHECRSNAATLVVTKPLYEQITLSLTRAETRQLRDALSRILGDV